MKPVVFDMIKIFQAYEVDWMGYPITKENKLTFHHIKKKAYGGNINIDNGALLTSDAHEELHNIETKDPKTFRLLNDLFKKLNETKTPPTEEYWHELRQILNKMETLPAPVKIYRRII